MLVSMTRIKAIIDTVSSSVLPLKFSYLEAKPETFPAAMLVSLGSKEIQKDTISNEITETWAIRLIFSSEESEAAQTKWVTLVDTITAELRKASHITLNGDAVNFVVRQIPPPVGVQGEYIQPVMIFDIIVDAIILKNIN